MKAARTATVSNRGRIAATSITIILLTGALLYLADGFYRLLTSGGGDLERRFDEQVAIAAGINPYGPIGKDDGFEPVGDPSGYPPWSLTFSSLLVFPSSFAFSRAFLAFLNFGCLAYVAWYAYCRFGRYGRLAGIFALSSALAVSANAVALRLGQFSIIVFALMVLTMQLSERARFHLAGATLALANIKPQVSGLVAVFFLADRRYDLLITMATIIVVATIITCLRISEWPIDLLLQMLENTKSEPSSGWESARYGILDFLTQSGVPHQLTVVASAVLAIVLVFVLGYRMEPGDWIPRMAVAATCAIIFTYHRRYDFMAMWFLFAAGLDQLLGNPIRGSLQISRLVILGLLGFSLWFPTTEAMYLNWPVFYGMNLLWLGALLLYVWDRRRHGVGVPT